MEELLEENPITMTNKEWLDQKRENKRIRDINEDNLKDLRQKAEYEKLMYEINHYRLESLKDYVGRANIMDAYAEAKVKLNPENLENPEK